VPVRLLDHIYPDIKELTPYFYGQFIPAKSGQGQAGGRQVRGNKKE